MLPLIWTAFLAFCSLWFVAGWAGGLRSAGTALRTRRRQKTEQSSVRLVAAGDDFSRSPTESQASSNESWRRALSSDGKGSPRSVVGTHDHGGSGTAAGSGGGAAIEEEELLQGASGTVEEMGLGPGAAEASVEGMSVTDLKAKAAEVRSHECRVFLIDFARTRARVCVLGRRGTLLFGRCRHPGRLKRDGQSIPRARCLSSDGRPVLRYLWSRLGPRAYCCWCLVLVVLFLSELESQRLREHTRMG